MIAGIRHSRAEKYIFRHNDPADLARLLDRVPAGRPKLRHRRRLFVGLQNGMGVHKSSRLCEKWH
jgi:7-keto-8-aminopelargonate synthetase-like enzyme